VHGSSRATLTLLRRCDNACVFCAVEGLERSEPRAIDDVRAELETLRAKHDSVSFVGGEPLLDPGLAEHVTNARKLGFARVGVQTNARRLAAGALAERLADAGLTDVHASIHGAEPVVHDYHTGFAGSFAQSLAGLAAARSKGLVVVATTVLTRSNFRVLAPIPQLLARRGVSAWVVSVPRVAGRAQALFDRVVPRLGLAIPFALHAIAAARASGLPAWIAGAPRCLLGPHGAHAMEIEIEPTRAYGAACEGCPARATSTPCPGADALYLARFGDGELAPRPVAEPMVEHAELRAMFVGAGPLAPLVLPDPANTTSAAATSPAQARVALPMLGKVRPALAEVSRSTEKKTGDALREILPALFTDPGSGEPREGVGE
jgi:hypothetical protein